MLLGLRRLGTVAGVFYALNFRPMADCRGASLCPE